MYNCSRSLADQKIPESIYVKVFFSIFSETLNGRLHPQDDSVRPQNLGKRVSDDPQHFIFRRRKHGKTWIFFKILNGRLPPRGWLRSASNFGKTRFRRSPTFHFSRLKIFCWQNFRRKISSEKFLSWLEDISVLARGHLCLG